MLIVDKNSLDAEINWIRNNIHQLYCWYSTFINFYTIFILV